MVVQGFGNAGLYAALLGEDILGLKLVAASDSKSGAYNAQGFNDRELVDYKLSNGTLKGFPNTDEVFNAELLELGVTVQFPPALRNEITEENGHVHVVHVLSSGEGRFLQVYRNNEAQEGIGFLGKQD